MENHSFEGNPVIDLGADGSTYCTLIQKCIWTKKKPRSKAFYREEEIVQFSHTTKTFFTPRFLREEGSFSFLGNVRSGDYNCKLSLKVYLPYIFSKTPFLRCEAIVYGFKVHTTIGNVLHFTGRSSSKKFYSGSKIPIVNLSRIARWKRIHQIQTLCMRDKFVSLQLLFRYIRIEFPKDI